VPTFAETCGLPLIQRRGCWELAISRSMSMALFQGKKPRTRQIEKRRMRRKRIELRDMKRCRYVMGWLN
jgi:hypothetical protein